MDSEIQGGTEEPDVFIRRCVALTRLGFVWVPLIIAVLTTAKSAFCV